MREFWNELVTRASQEKLQELSREFDFVLIGGWAAYLWTKAHKSKDIDIVVDYAALAEIAGKYRLGKNERLKKYEIKLGQFDIDVYVHHFSRLQLPAEDLAANSAMVEGIRVVAPEALLILKQGAEMDRRHSVKGKKDLIDIVTLLVYAPFDIGKYRKLLRKYRMENLEAELIGEINMFQRGDLAYAGMNEHSFSKWKKEFLEKMKE